MTDTNLDIDDDHVLLLRSMDLKVVRSFVTITDRYNSLRTEPTQVAPKIVATFVRSLASRGLAELANGYNDDGKARSGYRLTLAGDALIRERTKPEPVPTPEPQPEVVCQPAPRKNIFQRILSWIFG